MKIKSIERVDNDIYLLKFEGRIERVLVNIELKNKKIVDQLARIVFQKISDDDFDKIKTGKIEFKLDRFKIKKHKEDVIERIVPKLTSFLQSITEFDNLVKLDFKIDDLPSKLIQDINPILNVELKNPPNREKNTQPAFQDAYTKLAAFAFQHYHEDFAQNQPEDKKAKASTLIITKTPNFQKSQEAYVLIEEKNYNDSYPPHAAVFKEYYQHLISCWGKEKVSKIEYRYGINLKEMIKNNRPLTVDVIYQMNIGLGTRETQDIQNTREQLKSFNNKLFYLDIDTCTTLDNFWPSTNYPKILLKGLHNYFSSRGIENPSIEDLKKLLDNNPEIISAKPITELSFDSFDLLMTIYELSPEEIKNHYTGRQLGGFIDSAYTLADTQTFKPWVDDQELAECCDTLRFNTSQEYFIQQLSFVICKKHLMHRDPQKKYYVGSLIPGPLNSQNKIEWYRVTQCINNGLGNLSYTLEPVLKSSAAPDIKVFRSTASSPYAFDSQASVNSDLNPLNAPGYEGRMLVESYEQSFFHERSIPLWVAYHSLADRLLKKEQPLTPEETGIVIDYLRKASQLLIDQEIQKNQILSLNQIIKNYDWIVLKLLKKEFSFDDRTTININEKMTLYNLIRRYSSSETKADQNHDSQTDAQFLIRLLRQHPDPEFQLLKNVLQKNIINQDTTETEYNQQVEVILKNIVNPLLQMQHEVENLEANSQQSKLSKWSEFLYTMAAQQNELITQKKVKSVIVTGHSLGGALAQRAFANYTLLNKRLPLENQKIELYDFSAPGINAEDNKKFIEIGNEHSDLLKKWRQPVIIHRRQVRGDFIPLGGTTHLGATLTHEQTHQVSQWLAFDGKLQRATKQATSPGITDTPYMHGVQMTSPSYNDRVTDQAKDHILSYSFDTGVQGVFNQGNKYIVLDLWSLDKWFFFLATLEKQSAVLRTAYRTDLFISSNAYNPETLHGPWKDYTDPNGVFVIHEEGIMT